MSNTELIRIRSDEQYVMPGLNQVCFITGGQTLSLVLGSCISTVFIGRNDRFVMAANHIVIARQKKESIVAKRSAQEQIDDILRLYDEEFRVPNDRLVCLHLVGAGKKLAGDSFTIDAENVEVTSALLAEREIPVLFNDTRSHYFATFSLGSGSLSVFIEDKITNVHISYIIDLERLFGADWKKIGALPASALKPDNLAFEEMVEEGVIVFITGEKNRRYEGLV